MIQGVFEEMGVNNLNDGMPELEAKLETLKNSGEPESEKEIRILITEIRRRKGMCNQAFF